MLFGSKLDKVAKLIEKGSEDKLAALVSDKDEAVRLAAIDGLGSCHGDVAFNALVPLLGSAVAAVRAHAARALGKMGLPKARTHLLHLRDAENDADVLEAIDEALKLISVKF